MISNSKDDFLDFGHSTETSGQLESDVHVTTPTEAYIKHETEPSHDNQDSDDVSISTKPSQGHTGKCL